MTQRTERFINAYDLCLLLAAIDVRDRIRAIHYCDNLPATREVILIPEEQVIDILLELVDGDINILRLLAKLKVWTLKEVVEDGLWILSFI